MIDLLGPTAGAGGVPVKPSESRSFGTSDTFYTDCTSEAANDGTEWRAAAANQIIDLLRTVIRANGNTGGGSPVVGTDVPATDNADVELLLKSIQQLIQRGQQTYAVDTGTTDALVVALSPAMIEHKVGGKDIWIKKSSAGGVLANTVSNPTINFNGLGVKTLVNIDGGVLDIGQLTPGMEFAVRYDGTNYRITSPVRPATKAEVEAGVLANAFVSPATLFNRRQPYFILDSATPQSIASGGADTTLNGFSLTSSYLNTGSSFDGVDEVTIGSKDAGAWLVLGYAALEMLTAAVGGKDFRGAIAINGGTGPFQSTYVDESSTYGLQTQLAYPLVNGDKISMKVFHSTGASRNVVSRRIVGVRLSGAV